MRHRLLMTISGWLAFMALSLLFVSCMTTEAGSGDASPGVISREEIQELGNTGDAYTLIQHYEPQWLETRGQGSINRKNEVVVYIEGGRQPGVSSLRQVSVTDVQKIEFLGPSEATMEYGSGHGNGAIMVHLREGRNPQSP
jgi:hypothetical protein